MKKAIIVISAIVIVCLIVTVIVPAFIGGSKTKNESVFSFKKIPDFYQTTFRPISDRYKFNKYSKQVDAENVSNTMGQNAIHMLSSVEDTICNSFIITTEDNKVIVMDGGHYVETHYFIEYLKRATGQDVPHVDAWFLSHAHDDHCEVFLNVVENYSDMLDFDKVYLNFPAASFYEGSDEWAVTVINEYNRLYPAFGEKECVLHDGDVFEIGAAKFTVFYTFDPEFKYCNNGSLIFRIDLGGKSAMFTGDAGVQAGQKTIDNWAKSGLLNCDICQMAHHGQNGCDKPFYEAVDPDICLWPTPSWVWDNRGGNLKTLEVRAWIEELGVKENYVSKDGSTVLYLK